MKNELDTLRQQIDSVDEQIINLISDRMTVVSLVGEYKKKNNIPPLDPKRWQEVLDTRLKLAREKGLDIEMIRNIYENIHDQALKIESRITK